MTTDTLMPDQNQNLNPPAAVTPPLSELTPQQPAPPPLPPQGSTEAGSLTPTPSSKHPLILIAAGAIVAISLAAGGAVYYQKSQKETASPKPTIIPASVTKATTTPSAVPVNGFEFETDDDQTAPAISDRTDLETIEAEFNNLEILSPESELAEIDQDASQL